MDDSFIRAVAALQAHLITLEEADEEDVFEELSDMLAVRQLKTRLNDYIEAHTAKGSLPPGPYRVIAERLGEVARFFGEAKTESDLLLNWKKNWLKKIPNVGLANLQEARAGLDELVHKLPEIQARLAAMIHPLDWDETKVDLHPELQICAYSIEDLSLPDSAAKGPSSGESRVLRGGSWRNYAAHCRAAPRNRFSPYTWLNCLGFRPALVPSE